ncbi:MAG: hypothetical protein JWN78_379 [Bacteroidota bacterium]|nr:hypothetical protein [Bacteroidota bacterium]
MPEFYIFISMFKNNLHRVILIFFISVILMSCHKGVGCPADQYNDWKKIEASRKQQTKSPGNPQKRGKGKPKVVGNGVVPQ